MFVITLMVNQLLLETFNKNSVRNIAIKIKTCPIFSHSPWASMVIAVITLLIGNHN